MEIIHVEVFDLFGDGTLVLKTDLDNADENIRYAWYISFGKNPPEKTKYLKNNFLGWEISDPGVYKIKAWAMNIVTKEKVSKEVTFTVNRITSPVLFESFDEQKNMHVDVFHVEGAVWRITALGDLPEYADYAWYVYRDGEDNPVYKTEYAPVNEFLYEVPSNGKYRFKFFCRTENDKMSFTSDWVDINIS